MDQRTSRLRSEPGAMDLAELLAMPGVREDCILRSSVGFLALHGGSQDRGTEQIARRAAEIAGASYYAIVQPPGLRVHLTSRLHEPHHSALLTVGLEHVDVAISLHGSRARLVLLLWFDPDCGLVVEPYGPALRGRQTGPLRGIIVGGLNAQLLDAAHALSPALRRLPRRRRTDTARVSSRQSGQPSKGPRRTGRAAPRPARHRRFRRGLRSPTGRHRVRGGGGARRTRWTRRNA